MNIDDDYDNDGNNIVPCPICLDVYCPSKEDGKCPQEDEFAKHYLNTPDTEWETQDAILQVFKDKYPLPSIGYDGSEQDFKERKIQYCLVKELIYRAVVSGKKSLKHLLTSRDTYWQNHEQDMYESLEKANREQTILDVARVRDERDTYWKERETKAYEDGFRCGHREGHKDGVSYRSSQMRDFISKETQDGGMDESWYGAFSAMKRHLEALDTLLDNLK